MKTAYLLIVLVLAFGIMGCSNTKGYVCPSGYIVDKPEQCETAGAEQKTTPPSFGNCDQIKDTESKTICLKDLAIKNLDAAPCLQIEKTFDRDVCLRNVAIKMRDSSVCQQIVTPDIKQICMNDFS